MTVKHLSRRNFLRLSALVAGGATLSACAAPAATDEPLKSTDAPAVNAPAAENLPAEEESVEVEYFAYDLGQANASREEMFKAFTGSNPSITVKNTVLPYGENWQKLAALMASGTPPDVIYGDFSLLRHALVGELLDLTNYFMVDPVLSKPEAFTTDMQDSIQAKFGTDKIYNLILGTWVPILYYNRDIFDAAGEAYPDETWTWEKVGLVAKTLTDPAKSQYGFQWSTLFDVVGWRWWEQKADEFWAVPQVYPEKTIFDSDFGVKTLSGFEQMGVIDKSMMPFTEAGAYEVYGAAFGAGKAAMYNGGDWDAGWGFRELPFNWDMTYTPKMLDDYRPALNCMVATSTIAAGTKHPDQAWKLASFISASKEGQSFIGEGAYETPVLKEVANSDAVMKPEWAVDGYNIRVKSAEIPGPMFTPYQLSLNLWEFSEKFLNPAIEKISIGELKIADAVKQLDIDGTAYFAALNEELKTIKK
jgi:multiple sugar transport system substrate-binding protein